MRTQPTVTKHLGHLGRQLQAKVALSVEKRTSGSGVPHLVVTYAGNSVSVCWFGESRRFRIFYPYPASDQRRIDVDHVNVCDEVLLTLASLAENLRKASVDLGLSTDDISDARYAHDNP